MNRLETLAFGFISLLLQGLAGLRERWIVAIVLGLLILAYAAARLLQWRLTRHLRVQPAKAAPVGRMEAKFSIAAPVALLYFLLEWIVKGIRNRLLQRRRSQGQVLKEVSGKQTPAEAAVVVATLGPTFFLSGVLSGVTYWLAWLTGPLFARSYGVSPGHSFWQYLFLGQRPEFAWLLPLENQPLVAVVLCLVFWMIFWWTLGNVLRGLVFRSELQRNLNAERDSALPLWTSGFGVAGLTEPGLSYRRWATWLTTFAILLVAAAWTTLGREEGGVAPSALALGLVFTLSWVLHLRLRGFPKSPAPDASAPGSSSGKEQPGWPEVEEELRSLYGIKMPEAQLKRSLSPLGFPVKAREVPTLSPLAAELLSDPEEDPETAREPVLTIMQSKVLASLSLLGYVHLQPPAGNGALTLQRTGPDEIEDRSGLSERHQIVLAPEGSGKTTLAMLAAANHALVHTRATLMITRFEAQAEEACARIRSAVDPSTVRWNLRLRRLGRDFAADLSRDIIPDVVVASLRQLVTSLLDNTEIYTPFLRNVGLVVVDDVESFAGAVEIHAQLAFRRLHLLFRELTEVERLGKENAPLMLVLGVDSMKETAAWAKSLCAIQAAVHLCPEGAGKVEETAKGKQRRPDVQQKSFRLSDLRTEAGRPLTVAEVAGACEARGVAWHYRPCGDGRRQRGRGPLLLEREPEFACESPREACVLFLEGRWSEVRRELRRLSRAGCESGRSEIVFLTAAEPEEETACEALDPSFGLSHDQARQDLSDLGMELAALPLPIVRPPSSAVVQSHLLSDLIQRWIEVKDLVDTFEAPVARSLRHLKSQGMLYTEERSDVRPELKEYESKVYVRALTTALAVEDEGSREEGIAELSPFDKVRQVELVSTTAVTVRNRADHTQLCQVEADSAGLVYYPGRVFEDSRGRFVVVGRTRKGDRVGAVEVEPALYDDLSSPRRRFEIVEIEGRAEDEGGNGTTIPYLLFPPELVLLGRDPVEIGLVAIEATIRSLATYRLDRVTGEVHSRELHGETIQQLFQPTPLATVALLMHPNPERSPAGAPPLRFGEARLLAMLLRFLLPLLYRDTRDHLEVALCVAAAPREEGSEPSPSPAWDTPLGPRDGFYVLDLHQGGNGTARALYREGLELPLRLCRHFLDQVSDFQRLLRLYDHWGDLDEILAEDRPEKEEEIDELSTEEMAADPETGHDEEPVDAAGEGLLEEPAGSAMEAGEELVDGESEKQPEDPPGSATEGGAELAGEERRREAAWPWAEIRLGLRGWLASRLHPEPVQESSSSEASKKPEEPT